MMRILVIGGGIAAERYVESLIWTENQIAIAGLNYFGKAKRLSKEYCIPYYDFVSLEKKSLAAFEIVIVCVPVEIKYDVIHRLVCELRYKGRVILEKPFSIGIDNIEKMHKIASSLEYCVVACQRDFDIENYRLDSQETYEIVWYSIKEKLYDNIAYMMPHLLSWLIIELGRIDIDMHVDKDIIVGQIGEIPIYVRFVVSKDNYVVINGKKYCSPNYRKINAIIVEKVMMLSKQETKKNLERAVLVSKIISTLISEV